jgi:Cysteine-rich secretory protein family
MAAGHFFGHQSPTTGRIEDRVRRAGVSVIKLGENVSQGDSVEAAHAALMASPSHRANMLEPAFTHVGIGVLLRPMEPPAVLATLVFARRPHARAQAMTSAAASDFISSRRRARGNAPLRIDAVLQQAAEAGMDVVRTSGATVLAAGPLDAAQTALTHESKRLHQSRPAVCTQLIKLLELEELEDDRMVTDAHLGRIGVAAAERKSGTADKILILVVVESATCE